MAANCAGVSGTEADADRAVATRRRDACAGAPGFDDIGMATTGAAGAATARAGEWRRSEAEPGSGACGRPSAAPAWSPPALASIVRASLLAAVHHHEEHGNRADEYAPAYRP